MPFWTPHPYVGPCLLLPQDRAFLCPNHASSLKELHQAPAGKQCMQLPTG